MNPSVSVIIPIYNTAKYLDKCIESVVNQTEDNLQIILVDDGATDASPAMCDAWAKKDDRIQVIHKQNEGLGFTRNAGLNAAAGKYVSFLDSDDTLELDTYEKCIKKMEKTGARACYFGRKTMDKEGNFHLNPNIPDKLVFSGTEVKSEFAKTYFGPLPKEEQHRYIQASACCVLYERAIIEENHIRFCSEREYLSEDTFFNLDICRHAEYVCILPENFYNYTYNAASLTKQYSDTKFERCKEFYRKLEGYIREFPELTDAQERVQALFIGHTRGFIKSEIAALKLRGWKETYRIVKKMCEDKVLREIYGKFPVELLDRNGKIYLNWARKKQIVLLIVYYAFIKR